jgi:glycosyltransferase involved in cell wall biosynthesis
MKKIAVVIPCYNEAKSIAKVINEFPNNIELEIYGLSIQIFVIDNNSNDNTAKIATKMRAIVIFEPKKGKGKALRTGFTNIPNDIDYIVTIDGDNTYRPKELLQIIEPLRSDSADVVIGSRMSGKIHKDSMALFNLIGNRIFTYLVRHIYKTDITDALSGYYACKKKTIDHLYPYLISNGFTIEIEMITKMTRLGYRTTSIPITYNKRSGKSNLKPVKDGFRIMYMFLRNLYWKP